MRIVTCMGYVYKVSERKYQQLLRTIAKGEEVNWDSLTPLADRYENLTDTTTEEAQSMLDDLQHDEANARHRRRAATGGAR
jgi:hypothetical protein